MRIGVFVGSFNPIHIGHIDIANKLIDNNIVDKIIFSAGNDYWDKKVIDIEHRINMLKFYESDKFIVETHVNGLPYTYMVLEKLAEKYADDEIYLILGADQLINFDKWKNLDSLLNFKILIVSRNNLNINNLLHKFDRKDNFIVTDVVGLSISSTLVRSGHYEYLDDFVKDYIIDNNLYNN